MLTCCPECDTTFRVTPEQLKVRSGRVRCGQCQHVFSALDTLIEEPVVTVVAASPVPPPVSVPSPEFTPESSPEPEPEQELRPEPEFALEPLPQEESEPVPDPEAGQEAVAPAPTFEGIAALSLSAVPDPEPAPESASEPAPANLPDEMPLAAIVATDAPTELEPVAAAGATSEPVTESAPEPQPNPVVVSTTDTVKIEEEAAPLPDFLAAEPPVPVRRWPWVIASALALVGLGLQALLAFRVDLAVMVPEARPVLVELCDLAGCVVDLPKKSELLSIETSDLHPDPDPQRKGQLQLTATLKNQASFAQQFPHLELTLTDTADQAIARKVLRPADYLDPRTRLAAGMRANADLAVVIGVKPQDMAASGYRLYLFYP